jgi:hypothetical protein
LLLTDEPDVDNIDRLNCRRIRASAKKKVLMDNLKRFPAPSAERGVPAPQDTIDASRIHIANSKTARLLLVLHEIDQAVAGLEDLPQTDLVELVSSAILACGFADGTEARLAIVEVLQAIERRGPTPQSS